MTVLSTTTRLFCIFAVYVYFLGNSFFIGYLRSTYISLYLELTEQTVNDDLQMKFTHTGNDCLTSLLICMSTEGRILLSQFCKSFTHLALTGFGLRLDSQLDNRLRELHGLKDYRMLIITDGITSTREFESYCCCDISGINFIQLLSLVCVHLKDTSNTLFFIFGSIQYVRTGVHGSGIYTEECQFTYERVSHDLEYQCGERLFIRRMSYDFVSSQIGTLDRRNVQRRRHELDDCIQKLLDTFVTVSSSTANRNSSTLTGSFSQYFFHFLIARFFAFQISHHQIVVQLADLLYQLTTIQFCIILHILGDIYDGNVLTLLIVIDVCFHLKQVDDTFELVLFTDGQLNADCILAKSCFDLLYGTIKVCAKDIHLVDECHTRNIVGVSLTPNVLRLRLYTTFCTEYTDSAIQYT